MSLKEAYRYSTGVEPRTGAGSFAELVEEFLIAVGRGNETSKDYVTEALGYLDGEALKEARKVGGRFLPSKGSRRRK
jgi:fermentation-respiration switch protein FrsA (DUF1100 family)